MVYYTEEEVGKNERWSPMRSIEEISKTNPEKPLLVQVDGREYYRCPIHTHQIKVGENLSDLMTQYVKPYFEEGDVVYISEKIVSLCQRDIIPKESVKLSRMAKFLARFASTNDSAGIGVHNVYKMQVAIMLCGKPKVLYAALAAGVGRIFGKRGVFYEITGPRWRAWTAFTAPILKITKLWHPLSQGARQAAAKVEEETGVHCCIADINDLAARCWRCPPSPPWTSPCCKSC